jgi:hypothetical protein
VPRSSNAPRAFSLVELVTSLAISTILVGAMGVTLITASSAMERGIDGSARDRGASEAMAILQADLAAATGFYERTARSVWFSVPDRDHDGTEEHIRYSWSGIPGDPLKRSTNFATDADIAEDIRELSFTFDSRPGVTRTVSAERLLATFSSQTGATTSSTTITGNVWGAEIVRPTFAADVVDWKVTRLRLPLRSSGIVDAMANISIRALGSDNLPSSRVFAETEVRETMLLGTFRAEDVTFASCEAIPPGTPVAIVIRGISGTAAPCMISYQNIATPVMPFNMWRCVSSNGGSSWTAFPQTQNIIFELYGIVTTEGY